VPSALIYEGYGCTEAASFISANPADARRAGAVGLSVPGCEVSIQDENGRTLPAGQDGEICVRSPGVMTGYWNSQDTAVLADGWLHTGDIGDLDADGYLYVVDRKKDLIIQRRLVGAVQDLLELLLASGPVRGPLLVSGLAGSPRSSTAAT
jgi:long-chain acyl-CoA synthetase